MGETRLVYVTSTGKRYHHRPHHSRYMVTWAQRFAERGLRYEPCQVCFRGRRPRHRGRLVEANGTLGWISGTVLEAVHAEHSDG